MLVHGTCIDFSGNGVLLRGGPGCGKSDLALRLIRECRAGLVSDDRVCLTQRHGLLFATAPASIYGLLEVRGIGVIGCETVQQSCLKLVLDLCNIDAVPRMYSPQFVVLAGVEIPVAPLHPFEHSAPAKTTILLEHALAGFPADPV